MMICRTAGLPQYGQLGHGTNNEVSLGIPKETRFWIFIPLMFVSFLQYNSKDSSVKLVYEPQSRPRAIAAFSGKTVVKVACGTNHTGSVLVL